MRGNHGRPLWRTFVIALLLVSSGLCPSGSSHAERARPIRIGALNDSWGPTPAEVGLRDGLVKLGYRENEQFFLGIRFTQGDTDALLEAARGLVGQGVNVLFASQPGAAIAAQRATNQIPIVFTDVADPLGLGLVQSFARPSGNITGGPPWALNWLPRSVDPKNVLRHFGWVSPGPLLVPRSRQASQFST